MLEENRHLGSISRLLAASLLGTLQGPDVRQPRESCLSGAEQAQRRARTKAAKAARRKNRR